jgi:hypothetical protein
MGRRQTLVGIVGVVLMAAATAAQSPAPPTKFVTPFKGEALLEMMPSKASNEGNLVVTKFKVKNVSPGPLVGFKVEEFWYNAKGQTVSGSQAFRMQKPFMPGDVVEVTLKSPKTADMERKLTTFSHQHGKVKNPKQVQKFSS